MSLIVPTLFPRSAFNMIDWFDPLLGSGVSTLDLFDPFDALDRSLGRNLTWLDVPSVLEKVINVQPRFPKKYRVSVDCHGFAPGSIKTNISEDKGKLVVQGEEGAVTEARKDKEQEDYTMRSFRRTFTLPENLNTDELVSFMTKGDRLIIEMPFKQEEPKTGEISMADQFPRIVDSAEGKKNVEMNCWLPENMDPKHVKVTCKDRDLIVQAEQKQKTEDAQSRVYYYHRCTLPDNTDFDQLKCSIDNGNQLHICAPLNLKQTEQKARRIPIEVSTQQSIQSKVGELSQEQSIQSKVGELSQEQLKEQSAVEQ